MQFSSTAISSFPLIHLFLLWEGGGDVGGRSSSPSIYALGTSDVLGAKKDPKEMNQDEERANYVLLNKPFSVAWHPAFISRFVFHDTNYDRGGQSRAQRNSLSPPSLSPAPGPCTLLPRHSLATSPILLPLVYFNSYNFPSCLPLPSAMIGDFGGI